MYGNANTAMLTTNKTPSKDEIESVKDGMIAFITLAETKKDPYVLNKDYLKTSTRRLMSSTSEPETSEPEVSYRKF